MTHFTSRRFARILSPLMVLALLPLTGCASTEHDPCDRGAPLDVALIAGGVAHSPAAQLPDEARDVLQASAESNGSVTLVVPSGVPEVRGTAPLGSRANDAAVCEAQQSANVESVLAGLPSVVAEQPEVNILDALELGGRALGDGDGVLVVVHSGLQTVDPLDFARVDTLLLAPPSAVAADFSERGLLPASIAGRTIYWAGLGDVAGEQPPLTISTRRNLVGIYSAIVQAAGAELVLLDEPLSGTEPEGAPPVSLVAVDREATAVDWSSPVVLRESELRFVRGESRFDDDDRAEEVLREIAVSIIETGTAVIITGTASREGAADNRADARLGLRRAQATRDALIGLGVPARLLEVQGVGFEWCGFREEVGPDGSFSEAIAAQNRSVIITAVGVELCSS